MFSFKIMVSLIAIILIAGLVLADDNPVKPADSIKQVKKVEKIPVIEKMSLIGNWVMIPNKYILDAEYTFQEDGKYIKSELDKDSVRAGLEGYYIFDNSAKPCKLELCLGKCGAPGSEWTTTYGIARFLSSDSLEVRLSPDGNYPAVFDTIPDYHTMILIRKAEETKK